MQIVRIDDAFAAEQMGAHFLQIYALRRGLQQNVDCLAQQRNCSIYGVGFLRR